MSNKNFDDIIKQKADNHEASVPADAWDNIAGKKKRRIPPFFWWSLSSLLVIGLLFVCFHSNKTGDKISVAQNNQTKSSLNNSANNQRSNSTATSGNNHSINSTTDSITTFIAKNKESSDKENNQTLTTEINNASKSKNNNSPDQTKTIIAVSGQKDNTNKQTKKKPVINNQSLKTLYASNKKRITKKARYKGTFSAPSAVSDEASNSTANKEQSVDETINKDDQNETIKPDLSVAQNNNSVNKNDSTVAMNQTKIKPDSITKAKETDIGKTENKNKKDINASIKKRALILDFDATPFISVQKYDKTVSIIRFSNGNNVHSKYVANSVNTSLKTSASFGLAIRKMIINRLYIGTGLQYAQIKENLKLSGIETDTNYSPVQRLSLNSSGPYLANDTITTITNGIRNINAVNSYSLLSVPLFINYVFINHPKFSLSLTGGIYFTFGQYHNSIEGKLESTYADSSIVSNNGNKINEDIFGGIRLSWTVRKKWQLFFEPNYRHNLNKYELENSPIDKKIDQAGISFGVSYILK